MHRCGLANYSHHAPWLYRTMNRTPNTSHSSFCDHKQGTLIVMAVLNLYMLFIHMAGAGCDHTPYSDSIWLLLFAFSGFPGVRVACFLLAGLLLSLAVNI